MSLTSTCRNADRRPSPEEILQKQEAESWVYSSTMLYLYNISIYLLFFKILFYFCLFSFYLFSFIYLFILYIILGGLWAVSPLTGSIQNLLQTQQASPMHETPAREVLH